MGLLIGGGDFSRFLRGWRNEPFVIFIEVNDLGVPEFLDFHFFGIESLLFELFLIDFFLLLGSAFLP